MDSARYNASSSQHCLPGLTGPFCQLCIEQSHILDSTARQCHACSTTNALVLLAVVLAFILLAVLSACYWRRSASSRFLAAVAQRVSFRAKLRNAISFLQIVTQIDAVYRLLFPPAYTRLLGFLSIANLRLPFHLPRLSPVCAGLSSLPGRLSFATFVPLGVVVAAFPVAKLGFHAPLASALPFVLVWTFLLFPTISSFGFRALMPCVCFEYLDGDEICFLHEDYAVECTGFGPASAPADVLWSAWVAIAVWAVGVPLLYAVLLFNKKRLHESLGFLIGDYKPGATAWGLVTVGEKLILVGFLSLLEPGAWTQLFVAVLCSLGSFLLQAHVAPYMRASDNFFAFLTAAMLVLVLLGSLGLQSGALAPRLDISETVVVVVLFVATLGVVLVAFIFFVMEVHEVRKQRVLCYKDTGRRVRLPTLQNGNYHIFLSHVWSTGQDQMRVVKQRLLEMTTSSVCIFLDVDDLREGKGAEYVDRSGATLIFLTSGYVQSVNCMRELLRTVLCGKPVITLLEPETKHGGIARDQILRELEAADAQYLTRWGNANLGEEVAAWLAAGWLSEFGSTLAAKLVRGEAIAVELWGALSMHHILEFSRLPPFQNVTMRAIIERLLPEPRAIFLRGELSHLRSNVPVLGHGRFHVFCSAHNAGALELVQEVEQELNLSLSAATDTAALDRCEAMLVYLDGRTWTSGAATTAFAEDVTRAMAMRVPLLLAHEMPDMDVQAGRHAVEFASFFAAGATPQMLIDAGIYASIATPLKGGVWRRTSLVMVAQALGAKSGLGVREWMRRCARRSAQLLPWRSQVSLAQTDAQADGEHHEPQLEMGSSRRYDEFESSRDESL